MPLAGTLAVYDWQTGIQVKDMPYTGLPVTGMPATCSIKML